jgi:hypothetical protein
MMGRQTVDQSQLFYVFNLEGRIPERHLLAASPLSQVLRGEADVEGPPLLVPIGRQHVEGLALL